MIYENNRIVKKAKLSESSADMKQSSVLRIKTNDLLKVISEYNNLIVLKLNNTHVEKIEKCPNLHSLKISYNKGITSLNLNSVEDIHLDNVLNLSLLNMSYVKHATIKHLPSLSSIVLPNAINVYLNNIDLSKSKVKTICMPEVRNLRIKNMKGVKTQDSINFATNLSTLIIENCDLVCLNKLDNFDVIIIRNCPSLQMISTFDYVKKLTIENCPRLFSCENLTNMGSIHFDRCDSLIRIRNIEAANLTFEYCFSLSELDLSLVENIEVNRCHALSRIIVHPELEELHIDHCSYLDDIIFTHEYMLNGAELNLTILGNNMITDIDNWWVSRLTIKENQTLETMTNVSNLNHLIIEDCHELNSISHMMIVNSLKVQCCTNLESIDDVFGFKSISLIDCDALNELNITYSYATTMIIKNSPDLNFTFKGNQLERLTLEDIGIPLIKSMNPTARISISNVQILPDLESDIPESNNTDDDDDGHTFTAALTLRSLFDKMSSSYTIISNMVLTFKIRKCFVKYMKLKKENNLCDCVICQEPIDFQTGTFTACNHLFHRDCLATWMDVRRTCPLCNTNL